MPLKASKINDKIILVRADSQDELGSTFLRFQEHYESPEWKGKIFTIGQLRSWYSEKYGADTYEKDWSGFNIPSHVLEPFKNGLFDPLTDQEKEFISLFKYRCDRFYIIGAQDDDSTLDHEICHGLYYTSEPYKRAVDEVLADKRLYPVYKMVKSMMYHKSVWDDEVHAYASADFDYLIEKGIEVPDDLHKKLRKIKNRFMKK